MPITMPKQATETGGTTIKTAANARSNASTTADLAAKAPVDGQLKIQEAPTKAPFVFL